MRRLLVWGLLAGVLTGCGTGLLTALTYSVGGTISGITTGEVVLQNNSGDNLTLTADGRFTFTGRLSQGAAYLVTVYSSPTGYVCTPSNNSGTVGTRNVTNVAIVCASSSNSYYVGGTVTGLSGTLILLNNTTDALTITQDGSFQFATKVADGSAYSATISTQPSGMTCAITGATGSGTVAGADVSSVAITCATNTYSVSGSVSGLGAVPVTLALSGVAGNTIELSSDGAYTFRSKLPGGSYTASVSTQPSDRYCTFNDGGGNSTTVTISNANVTGVVVTCVSLFPVGGNVSGIASAHSVTMHVAYVGGSQSDVAVTSNTSFEFANPLEPGLAYTVSIAAQSANQTCTITSGATGNAGASSVTATVVSCTYSIGGSASLLGSGKEFTLLDTYGVGETEMLTVLANGTFTFLDQLPAGTGYNVTFNAQPSGENCAITSGGSGTVDGQVTNVTVTCSFSVGGSVNSLTSGKTLVLRNNLDAGSEQTVVGTGAAVAFSFTGLADEVGYSVTVSTQPEQQYCTVADGSGTIANNNVSTVIVTCADAIVLYATPLTNGNLLGLEANARDGANAMCVTEQGTLSCETVLAFISISTTDQINDMTSPPFSVPTNRPVTSSEGTFIATNWTDLKTLSLPNTLSSLDVLPVGSKWWSGSNSDWIADWTGIPGSDATCNSWTDADAYNGRYGDSEASINPDWFSAAQQSCATPAYVLCICY